MENDNRSVKLDLIRCIAVFEVISVHFFLNNGFYNQTICKSLFSQVCFRTLFMTCVPLFMILTGYLMNKKELYSVLSFFNSHGLGFNFWNCNPNIKSTKTGCFDYKFYFSVLLNDKAGFDPDTDWKLIYEYLKNKNEI